MIEYVGKAVSTSSNNDEGLYDTGTPPEDTSVPKKLTGECESDSEDGRADDSDDSVGLADDDSDEKIEKTIETISKPQPQP